MKASPDLTEWLKRLIARNGELPVADYMRHANAHYYATRDPLGPRGDFVTAPEISQMFGELAGAWLADLWQRSGQSAAYYVELGPGRGTLAADALRAMKAAGLKPSVQLVETSPLLRGAQAELLPDACWHEDTTSLPSDRPLLIVANEFFDALPIAQYVATARGWRERVVIRDSDGFAPGPGRRDDCWIPEHLRRAPVGTIFERNPVSEEVVRDLGRRIAIQGGAILIFDYGHIATCAGETLQAVAKHGYADPWHEPGERDLTAHVDFEALAEAASEGGAIVAGPREQGDWLKAMGIEERASALRRNHPERAEEIEGALTRLTAADQMGSLFKCMALTAPGWPDPAGFA